MQRWLIISNCQTYGLAHSLQMLSEGLEVTPVDVGEYRTKVEHWNGAMAEHDRTIITFETENVPGADFSRAQALSRIPPLSFAAYHPDLTYIFVDGAVLNGPLDAYHSVIALAAHAAGLTRSEARALYTGRFYEAAGYLDRWVPERDAQIALFGHYGLDIARPIRRWGRESAFMYSTNHPKIRVLHDIARLFLEAQGMAAEESGVLPHDNLANSSCFPVYPEIGEALGVPGNYRFKRCARYAEIGLDQFLDESFALYDRYPARALTLTPQMQPVYDRVAALI